MENQQDPERRSQRANRGVPPNFLRQNYVGLPGATFNLAITSTPVRPHADIRSNATSEPSSHSSTMASSTFSRNNSTAIFNYPDMSTIRPDTVPGVSNMEAMLASLADIVTERVVVQLDRRLSGIRDNDQLAVQPGNNAQQVIQTQVPTSQVQTISQVTSQSQLPPTVVFTTQAPPSQVQMTIQQSSQMLGPPTVVSSTQAQAPTSQVQTFGQASSQMQMPPTVAPSTQAPPSQVQTNSQASSQIQMPQAVASSYQAPLSRVQSFGQASSQMQMPQAVAPSNQAPLSQVQTSGPTQMQPPLSMPAANQTLNHVWQQPTVVQMPYQVPVAAPYSLGFVQNSMPMQWTQEPVPVQPAAYPHVPNVVDGYGTTYPVYEQPMLPQMSMLPTQPYQFVQTTAVAPRKLIDLPEFDGQPELWPRFVSAYNETTATYTYTDIENHSRLLKALKGDAKDAVEGLLVHPQNVKEVMARLEFRFGRPELLVRNQLAKIRAMRELRDDDFRGFVNYATKVGNMVALFTAAGAHAQLFNPTLLEELVARLPVMRKIEWARQVCLLGRAAIVSDLESWLNTTARLFCIVEPQSSLAAPRCRGQRLLFTNEEDDTVECDTKDKKETKDTVEETVTKKPLRCTYCQGVHPTVTCPKFKDLSLADKWKWVRENRVCFSCIQKGHQLRNCPRNQRCSVEGCKHYHHPMLHGLEPLSRKGGNDNVVPGPPPHKAGNDNGESQERNTQVLSIGTSDETVAFRVLPVVLIGPKSKCKAYALIDEGSCVSLMEAELADELGLEGDEDVLHLQWYDNKVTRQEALVVTCQIHGVESDTPLNLRNVKAVKNLNLPGQSLNLSRLRQQFPQLRQVPLEPYRQVKPRLLIGLNNARLTISKTVVECGEEGPIAVETPLGWVLYGPVKCSEGASQPVLMVRQSSRDDQLRQEIEQVNRRMDEFFQMESFGLSVEPKLLESKEHQRARQLLDENTQLISRHYQTGLLWRTDDVILPDNFRSTLDRLKRLQKGLQRKPDDLKNYEQALMQYTKKGYARKLSAAEINIHHPRVWYLPHFGVKHPDKDKVRVVFDCAAKTKGQSLNSNLIAGPDLNQPLFRVLSQFREFPIAVCGDLQEMFCQIKISPDDQHAQRYLWQSSDDGPIEVFEMTSMLFGAASSPCSALYVMQTNAERFKEEFPVAVEAIKSNHYVDDYLKSFGTEEEALAVTLQVKHVHAQGGFNLRSLVSNSSWVHQVLSESEEAQPMNMNLSQEPKEKVLGMYWDRQTDEFLFNFKFHRVPDEVRNGMRPPTKRELLSLVMSVFDPFGFLANVTIAAKLILQDTWSMAMEWDDVIPKELNERVQSWLRCMMNLSTFRIPRCHSPAIAHGVKIHLHVFTDASDKGIAAVAYWQIFAADGIKISFVCGKTRCAPRKPLTTPRLELQASVLGSRIKRSIVDEHTVKPERVVMWTDSKTVFLWINSESREYKPFVMHRIAEILANTEEGSWQWLPSEMNPADDGTRPNINLECDSQSRWIAGPDFLLNDQMSWSLQPDDLSAWERPEEKRKVSSTMLLVSNVKWILNYGRFSNYSRMLRCLAYVLRACENWRHKVYGGPKVPEPLKAFEVETAEQVLFKRVQMEGLSKEYEELMHKNSVSKSSSIYNVDPFLDKDGVMRCNGRINAAEIVPFDTRNPIILPPKHPVTEMLIAYHHARTQHMFNETVICKIRERFWIPHLRVELKRIRVNCQYCKSRNSKPSQPRMGQLPIYRLIPFLPPFTNTGLDYWGPVYITVGRHHEKRWIALFTCLNTRAVHVEIAPDYSTDALILCLRNFINLRGKPRLIVSDRGTNFIGFKGEIDSVPTFFDIGKVQEKFAPPEYNIEWKFNVPKDPSAGGVWERLIQTMKRALSAILTERYPKEHVLRSALLEAMNIVNSRPLTDVPIGSDDETPLTPNHFLIGHTNSTQTPNPINDKEVWGRKMWRQAQQLKDHFWRRWLREYLPTLTRRSKWHEEVKPLAVGELVVICDPDAPRNDWKRGKILKIFPGKDGQVRSAVVKTSTGEYYRPAHKLAVLDVCSSRSHGGGDVVEPPPDLSNGSRPLTIFPAN